MKIICWFRHRYYVVQEFSSVERRVACSRCLRIWAMHDGRQAFVPWDDDFTQLYRDVMEHVLVEPWRTI